MCYDDKAIPPIPPGQAQAIQSRELVLTASDGNQFMAYQSLPEAPTAQVLILPDIRGLHQFYKTLADRFAEVGIAAIALDYFGRTAGLGSRDESFEFRPHVDQLTLPGVYADSAAALGALQQAVGTQQAAFTIGFCLGGTLSFLAGAEPLPLAGVIGFYAGMGRSLSGRGTLLERAGEIHIPALGLFGGADQGIPTDKVEEFDQLLDSTGIEHTILIYPDAPHSFFDRRFEEYAEASADSWQQVLGFIKNRS